MRERSAIAGAVAVAVVGAGVAWGALASQAGCQLQGACDPDTVYVPALPAGVAAGASVSAQPFQAEAGTYGAVWQTSAIEGTWMELPGQRTYVISPQLPDGGPFVGPYTFPQVYLSADPNPYTFVGSNFAPSAGNPTEFSGLPDGGFDGFLVINNTCSKYFLWLQVAQEHPATPVAADASTSSEGSSEAGRD